MIIKHRTKARWETWIYEEGGTAVVSYITFNERSPETFAERLKVALQQAEKRLGISLTVLQCRICGDIKENGRVGVVSLFTDDTSVESKVFLFFEGVEAYLLNSRGHTIERII